MTTEYRQTPLWKKLHHLCKDVVFDHASVHSLSNILHFNQKFQSCIGMLYLWRTGIAPEPRRPDEFLRGLEKLQPFANNVEPLTRLVQQYYSHTESFWKDASAWYDREKNIFRAQNAMYLLCQIFTPVELGKHPIRWVPLWKPSKLDPSTIAQIHREARYALTQTDPKESFNTRVAPWFELGSAHECGRFYPREFKLYRAWNKKAVVLKRVKCGKILDTIPKPDRPCFLQKVVVLTNDNPVEEVEIPKHLGLNTELILSMRVHQCINGMARCSFNELQTPWPEPVVLDEKTSLSSTIDIAGNVYEIKTSVAYRSPGPSGMIFHGFCLTNPQAKWVLVVMIKFRGTEEGKK